MGFTQDLVQVPLFSKEEKMYTGVSFLRERSHLHVISLEDLSEPGILSLHLLGSFQETRSSSLDEGQVATALTEAELPEDLIQCEEGRH